MTVVVKLKRRCLNFTLLLAVLMLYWSNIVIEVWIWNRDLYIILFVGEWCRFYGACVLCLSVCQHFVDINLMIGERNK